MVSPDVSQPILGIPALAAARVVQDYEERTPLNKQNGRVVHCSLTADYKRSLPQEINVVWTLQGKLVPDPPIISYSPLINASGPSLEVQ